MSANPLDYLLDEISGGQQLPIPAARPQIAKVRYTHEAMINAIITNPAISQNELALMFGYSTSWISTVMTSDAFQEQLAARNKALVDPVIMANVETRFKGLVMRSMEILEEKLRGPASSIPDSLVLKTIEISSRVAGYGAKVETKSPETHVHVHLEDMGNNLVDLLRRKKAEALEGEFTKLTDDSGE